MAARFSASAVSSPASGLSRVSSSTAWRRYSASRCACSTRARCAATASSAVRRACPGAADRRGIGLEPRIGIEQPPVRRDIDQRALVVLAVDFDQRAAEGFQHLHADRLVVDEGARASVGKLHAAQDQAVLGSDAVFGKQRERRMIRRNIERPR